jgi:aspartyl/asparaginyl-tRNA synthetase
MFPQCWKHLRLQALDPHDLALTKLERNSMRDRADVRYLAQTGRLQKETLQRLYYDEYRICTTGRIESHDLTMKLWLEEFWS